MNPHDEPGKKQLNWSLENRAPSESAESRPVVLVASDGEWLGRSLSSVLELHGYSVRLVAGGRATIETARRIAPDAIFIDESLSEIGGLSACQALSGDPLFDHATPLIMVTGAPTSSLARTEAFAAGAWEYCSQPIDLEVLLYKLLTFIRARRELRVEREKLLIESETGIYSIHGFERMAEVIVARAVRNHEPLACLAIAPQRPYHSASNEQTESATTPLSVILSACQEASRRSDLLGHIGESRLAILAPETDSAGAHRFASRLKECVAGFGKGTAAHLTLCTGYCAADDLAISPLIPSEMVRRAESALRHTQGGSSQAGIMNFDQIPLS